MKTFLGEWWKVSVSDFTSSALHDCRCSKPCTHTCRSCWSSCARSVQPHGSHLLCGVSAPVFKGEIHTTPLEISPSWSSWLWGQGQPATPGLDSSSVVVWQQAAVEWVCNHITQSSVISSGWHNMFCGEHPGFIPELCIVNLWKWALSTEASSCCYNSCLSGDGGGFPVQNRVSTLFHKVSLWWNLWVMPAVTCSWDAFS